MQPETEESNPGTNVSEVRIPVIAEFLSVEKKQIETGRIHVVKHISEQVKTVDISLQGVGYEIDHIDE